MAFASTASFVFGKDSAIVNRPVASCSTVRTAPVTPNSSKLLLGKRSALNVTRSLVAEPRSFRHVTESNAVFNVEVTHDGKTSKIQVPSDKTILQAALDAGVELPNSCLAGVCTTCSAKLLDGKIDQSDAVLSPEVEEQGFVLLCSSYPLSDCKVKTVAEDELYQEQYGKYEA
uniref:Ferredoxin n=1 Tax=Cyanoptyche gloeocystis TaxID=77922 RepID=A0A7S2NQ33_9EUKA